VGEKDGSVVDVDVDGDGEEWGRNSKSGRHGVYVKSLHTPSPLKLKRSCAIALGRAQLEIADLRQNDKNRHTELNFCQKCVA
jgi:hypothetical protein